MVYVGYMSLSCQSFKSHCPHNDIGDGMGKYMLRISQCKDVCTDIYMYSYSYGIIVQHSPLLSSLKFHAQAQRLVGSRSSMSIVKLTLEGANVNVYCQLTNRRKSIHRGIQNLVFQFSGGMQAPAFN